MGQVVVELTGDEAKLLASMQKVIAQNTKVGDSFKGVGAKAKATADEAIKDAQRVERENKKAADQMYAEHQKMLENKAKESRQAAIEEQSLARKTALAEVQEAIKAAEQEIAAVEKITREKKKAADKEIADAKKANDAMVSNIAAMAAGYASVHTVVQGISSELSRQVEYQARQLQSAKDLAVAQQEAAKNLSGTDATQLGDLLNLASSRVALAAGMSDLPAIQKALGSSAGVVGPDRAESVVTTAAKLSPLTSLDLGTVATATADLLKATQLQNADEAMSLLLSAGSVARPESLPQLAGGATKAINAGVISKSDSQTTIDAAKEAAALFAMLSEVDPRGESAATATVQLIDQLRTLFKDSESDPGSVSARIKAVANDPEIRSEMLDDLKGEAIFKPLFEGLLTSGSVQQSRFDAASAAVTTDPKVFQDSLAAQSITPELRLARAAESAKASQAVADRGNVADEVTAQIRELAESAKKNNTLPMSLFFNVGEIGSSVLPKSLIQQASLGNDVDRNAQSAIGSINQLIEESAPTFRNRTPAEETQVELLRNMIAQIIELQNAYRESQNSPQQQQILELLRDQNRKVDEQTNVLQQRSGEDSASVIRAQVQNSQKE